MKNILNRQKLPKYWLGKSKPSYIGYEPTYYKGAQTSSTPGLDISSDTKTVRDTTLPNALNTAIQTAQPGLQTMNAWKTIPGYTMTLGGSAPAATTASQIASAGGLLNLPMNITSGIAPGATSIIKNAPSVEQLGSDWLGSMGVNTQTGIPTIKAAAESTAPAIQTINPSVTQTVGERSVSVPAKRVLGTASKVLGIAGAAWGLGNMASQIAHQGDYRSPRQMDATLSRNINTTAEGNQYETKGGVNLANELVYNDAQKTSRRLNFLANAMGTGFTIGSLFPGLGWAAGLGLGGLVGGLGSILGFGDNEDEIRDAARRTDETTLGWNRQNEDLALTKDIQLRYARGSVHGADGLRPVYTPFGLMRGKLNAWLSNGETIVHPDGSSFTIPGKPNKKDTKPAKINTDDAVLSNNGGSQYYLMTGDLEGALAIDDTYRMKKYCKGKLPFFKGGKLPRFFNGNPWFEYGVTLLPHLLTAGGALSDYYEAKNADTSAPSFYTPKSNAGLNALASIGFDSNPYKQDAANAYRQATYLSLRTPGISAGGRAALHNANFNNYLNALANINTKANEMNNSYLAAWANAKNADEAQQQQLLMSDRANMYSNRAKAEAARLARMDASKKSLFNAAGSAINDLMKVYQYNNALGIQNRQLDLFGRQVKNDETKTLAEIAMMNSFKPGTVTPTKYSPTTGFQWTTGDGAINRWFDYMYSPEWKSLSDEERLKRRLFAEHILYGN